MSDTTYFVAAVAAVIIREGKVLAMRRSATKDAGPGLWETLSGRIDSGEDPLEAVKREIVEECALKVRVDPRPVTAYHSMRKDRQMILLIYRAEYLSGEVVRSEEHDDHAWLTPDEFAGRSTLKKLVDAVFEASVMT
ncbi:MAG: NUDIX domain-containing protein [Proteobacteria bacterium]|nr:NUDIX domain-containing protein [Pseudomonadota bacterium]